MLIAKSRKVFRTAVITVFAVFVAIAAILIFNFCQFTINSMKCWSSKYGPLYYLTVCDKVGEPAGPVPEYEAGTIYYGLESGISEAIRNAQVIFVGSSKLQHAFSTQATTDYFAKQNIRFYILGFTNRNIGIVLPILKRKQASPSLLIVNVEIPFFTRSDLPGGLRTYWRLAKMAALQRLQRAICPNFPSFCSPPGRAIYRSANTGQWRWRDSYFPEQSLPFNELLQHEFSDNEFKAAVDSAERFLREISINRNCIVFIGIPNNVQDAPAIASQLAQRLGTQLILPTVERLFLLDDGHLNFESAEHWSAAFLSKLTPVLQKCLSNKEGHS